LGLLCYALIVVTHSPLSSSWSNKLYMDDVPWKLPQLFYFTSSRVKIAIFLCLLQYNVMHAFGFSIIAPYLLGRPKPSLMAGSQIPLHTTAGDLVRRRRKLTTGSYKGHQLPNM
jgi:hypothetical protein